MRRYRESWKARASLPVIMMYAYVCSIIWPPTQAHEARWVGLISSRVLPLGDSYSYSSLSSGQLTGAAG